MVYLSPGLQMAFTSGLIISLGLIAIGYFLRNSYRHILIGSGEIVFGLIWILFVPQYIAIDDTVNAFFCFMAPIFFGFLAFHEFRCYQWKQEIKPLDWIAGTTLIAAGIYFAIDLIKPLHGVLVYVVAYKSAALLSLFGYRTVLGKATWEMGAYGIEMEHMGGGTISIILACTGVQAIALFLGFILATKPNRDMWLDWAKTNKKIVKRKIHNSKGIKKIRYGLIYRNLLELIHFSNRRRRALALLYTVPVIYFTNLLRNAAIVYVEYEGKLNGMTDGLNVAGRVWNRSVMSLSLSFLEVGEIYSFDLIHNWITKILALLLMLFLFLLLFDVLPELHENFLGLMDVLRFHKKDNVTDGFVELPELPAKKDT